jgi:alpha-tubulin suppressor-like RCC1 family protein
VIQAADAYALGEGSRDNIDRFSHVRLWLVGAVLALAAMAFTAATASFAVEDAHASQGSARHSFMGGRLDSGVGHTCAILGNGTVRCWGLAGQGQLGYGNTTNVGEAQSPGSVGPVDLGTGRTAVALATRSAHTCVILDNGSVKCWGQSTSGALGYGNTNTIGDNETPGSVGPVDLGAGRTAIGISAGEGFTCALLDNGTVRCWGTNNFGDLGYGNTTDIGDNESPATAGPIDFGSGRTVRAIDSGNGFSCAILDVGSVKCWGYGGFGELGFGGTSAIGDNETPASMPTVDIGSGRTATAISAAGSHVCAILDTGAVRCWGKGDQGKLGYGNENNVGVPSSVGTVDLGPGRTAIAISNGSSHTCAILDNGTVRCWGDGSFGELGYGNANDIGDNETPGSVGPVDLGTGRTAVAISTGSNFTCALLDNGTTRCWGDASQGRLGYGNSTRIGDNEAPGSVGPVDLGNASGVLEAVTGAAHTCARFSNGSVRCWGLNGNGQLGYGNTTTIGDDENVGVVGGVDLGGSGAVQIAAGGNQTCALLGDSTVRCWGLNSNGQLGYGNTETIGDNETPAAVSPVSLGESAVQVASGATHACAALASGSVRCWGNGADGRLGYANTTTIGDNETPATAGPVVLGGSAISVTAGGSHSCAMLSEGTLRCWGNGASGQLGYPGAGSIGDNENPGVYGPMGLSGSAALVAAGGSHSCSVLTSGIVRCWGLAASGQLGYGNTNNIGDNEGPAGGGNVNFAGQSAVELAAGDSHNCAVLSTGIVRCWGSGADGRLGYANTNNIGDNETPGGAGPVDFGGGLNAMEVAAGGSHSCATLTTGAVKCWGLNSSGQLGYGNTNTIGDNETPAAVGPVDFVDDPPVAVSDSKTLAEDSGANVIDVLANDTDADAGPKAIVAKADGAHGTVTITGGGSGLTYQPAAEYCGADSFTYTLNGGSTATVFVTVSCVDDPPVAVSDTKTVAEDSGATAIDVLTNDSDIDLGPRTIQSVTQPAHGAVVITGAGSGLTYQPAANYCNEPPGGTPDTFTYTLNGGSSATVSVTVTCVDDPPVAVSDSKTLAEDSGANAVDVLANDTDLDAGPKTVIARTDGAHGTVAITGGGAGLTYQPAANYCGGDSFTYELNGGSTATVSINVTCVDDAPSAVGDSKELAEDAPATFIDALANDTDIDGGPMTIQAVAQPAHGTTAITGGGFGLTYQPMANYCGTDSFTYTLNGGSTAMVAVTVSCVDDPPIAVNDSDTVLEDSSPTSIDVLLNDTDVDGGPKSIAGKTNGAHGTVAILGGGIGLTYVPNSNYCGPDSFTYTLNGGSQGTVSISVTCADDPPAAVNDSATVSEDAGAQAIDVLANDTDLDGGSMTVVSKSNGAHGIVSIAGGGTSLTYLPDANYCGTDSFTYALNGGSTATVEVTVTCLDDPPTAIDDAATVAEDSGANAIGVLANDTDIDGGPKSIASKTEGGHGGVSITGGGGGLTYAPDANYCGPDSFTYTLSGGSTATVTVTVSCVDDPPVATGDSKTVVEDASPTAIDVLANDTDIDAGPRSIAAVTQPAHGAAAITGGGTGLTYTPNANYCNAPPGTTPDSFTYELNGGSSATVTITVSCADDPPTAAGDSGTVAEDATAQAIDVLANDTDIDGGSITISSKTNGLHGTVTITGGGAGLTYLPDANYCGPDSFTYTLNGGSTATVSITVTCVDDPPTAIDDTATVVEDSSANAIGVLANDADIDGGPKSIASKADGSHGAVSLTGGGTGLTYTPVANYCGADSFTYTLNGGSTATVAVTITCVDDSPAAVADSDTVLEDSAAQAIDVLANDTDLDGGPKSIAGKTNGSHGAVAIFGGGAGLTYQPDPNYCGPDSFTYTLNGGSAAAVTIAVTCVDEPAPPGEGGTGNGGGGQTIIQTTTPGDSSGPVVTITPGVGVVSGRRHPRIAVKGAFAFFTLTCRLADRDCSGTVTISVSVPSIALGPTMRKVVMVKGRFRIGSNRSVLVRARLTKRGKEALETKQSLRGVASTMAIVDAVNGEHGEIQVNLVRRPKASLLPSEGGAAK